MQDETKKISEQINYKLKEIKKHRYMLKGSINKVYTKCGNLNCKCTRGEKHEEYRLTYKGANNISKTIYLSKNKITKVKKMVESYQAAKVLFNEILELNVKLFKISK